MPGLLLRSLIDDTRMRGGGAVELASSPRLPGFDPRRIHDTICGREKILVKKLVLALQSLSPASSGVSNVDAVLGP